MSPSNSTAEAKALDDKREELTPDSLHVIETNITAD